MDVAKKIDKYISEEEQLKILKSKVLITFSHPDFKNKEGVLISFKQNKNKFWVYLDEPYKTQNGKYSRKKEFEYKHIKLLYPIN